jgi:hypothetical protein
MWIYKGLNKRFMDAQQANTKVLCKDVQKVKEGMQTTKPLKKQAFVNCLSVNDSSNKGVNKCVFHPLIYKSPLPSLPSGHPILSSHRQLDSDS